MVDNPSLEYRYYIAKILRVAKHSNLTLESSYRYYIAKILRVAKLLV